MIIFEDNDLLVINKPVGWIVNDAETTKGQQTVQGWLQDRGLPNIGDRYGIVHRLDKETSGILLIAKTQEAFTELQRQFKSREVEKVYLAVVHGKVTPESGEINAPIARNPFNRMRFGVFPGGREAITRYHVISNFQSPISNLQLLEVHPLTGRTHQIRVHLKHIGYPIVGDDLYGGRKNLQEDRKRTPRMLLHAHKISFFHPVSHQKLSFEAPIPQEFPFV